MTPEPKPSAEAIALAVKLSGHNHCRIARCGDTDRAVCDGCLGDAATIDAALCLPQRNAALLLAQGVCDAEANADSTVHVGAYECATVSLKGYIDELREALAQIKTKP